MAAVTREFAAFTAAIRYDSLPAEVQERTRFLVLDLVGNMLRGRHDAESTAPLLTAVRSLGLAAGSAAVFGDSARYTPAGAALVNGTTAHSLDFDDTHAAGTLHPGAPVIPAALAGLGKLMAPATSKPQTPARKVRRSGVAAVMAAVCRDCVRNGRPAMACGGRAVGRSR